MRLRTSNLFHNNGDEWMGAGEEPTAPAAKLSTCARPAALHPAASLQLQ